MSIAQWLKPTIIARIEIRDMRLAATRRPQMGLITTPMTSRGSALGLAYTAEEKENETEFKLLPANHGREEREKNESSGVWFLPRSEVKQVHSCVAPLPLALVRGASTRLCSRRDGRLSGADWVETKRRGGDSLLSGGRKRVSRWKGGDNSEEKREIEQERKNREGDASAWRRRKRNR